MGSPAPASNCRPESAWRGLTGSLSGPPGACSTADSSKGGSLVRAHLTSGALRPVLQGFAPLGVDVHAVWPRQQLLSPRVRHMVDQLVACAAQGRLD